MTTWDTLPGEAATYLSDAETVLDTITTRLDDASNANTGEHYDLDDLHADLIDLRDMAEAALRAVGRVL